MAFDLRVAQDAVEDAVRDAILYALGRRAAAVTTIAALRKFPTRGATGSAMHDDLLAAVTVTGVTSGYRWNTQSIATDDGATVIKPNDVTANGRWVQYTSPLRIAPVVGGNSFYLHELTSGPLQRVLLIDKNMQDAEVMTLVFGQVPSVVIETTDDVTEPPVEATGRLLNVTYNMTLSVIAENLRDRRQAQQGSTFSNELVLGANKIDGLVQSLLIGTQMFNVAEGIRDVRAGRGYNWTSEQAMRRVIRGRAYQLLATCDIPPAPNDYEAAGEILFQQHTASLGDQTEWTGTYVVSGLVPTAIGPGLSKNIGAGSAVIAGTTISYVGQLASFPASSLTYRDLATDGTLTFTSTGPDESPPAVGNGLTRIGVTTTDDDGVVADRLITGTFSPYGPDYEVDL